MYEKHFGFREKPFELTPDPAFLHLSSEIKETIATLRICILERRGFLLLVGEPGTGKTTLINTLMDTSDSKTKFAYVFNPAFDFQDLLQTVLSEFGLAKEDEVISKRKAIKRLNNYAINRYEKGKTTSIIVDEAQYLDIATLENLRLLSNLETRKHKLIQIIIAGQPELEFTLSNPMLRQLTQRISLRRRTEPLNDKACNAYISHRLKVAGYTGPQLFANRARNLIAEYSKGIPRTINILCDGALLIAFAMKKKRIDSSIIKEAIQDLQSVSVDAGQEIVSDSNSIKRRSYSLISKDPTAPSTDDKLSLLYNEQESSALTSTKKNEEGDAPENVVKNDKRKSSRRITLPRASVAILSAIFILNLCAVAFYFWGKDRYRQDSGAISEQSVESSLSVKSEGTETSESQASDTVEKALNSKLEGLYNRIEEMKIALEDKMKKNQERQEEMQTSIEEKLKKNQERQNQIKASIEEKKKQNQAPQIKASLVEDKSVYSEGLEDNYFNTVVGLADKSDENFKWKVIRKGESLYRIIIREYGELNEELVALVMKSNPDIINPDHILENHIIKLPNAAYLKLAKEE